MTFTVSSGLFLQKRRQFFEEKYVKREKSGKQEIIGESFIRIFPDAQSVQKG